MNVLLTGGTDYLGSHTAVVLSKSGHRVILYDNLSNSSDSVLEKLAQITGQPIPFINGDVRDTALLKGTLAAHQVNAVVPVRTSPTWTTSNQRANQLRRF